MHAHGRRGRATSASRVLCCLRAATMQRPRAQDALPQAQPNGARVLVSARTC
jgi:hypothetical protein